MGKRIFLFLAHQPLVVLTLSVVLSVLGVGRYIGPDGLDIGALAIFCFVWGMGGAFISLQMSRWIAKRATGMQLVDGQYGARRARLAVQTVERLTQQANLPMPEVGIYESPEVNAFATGPSKSRSLVAVSTRPASRRCGRTRSRACWRTSGAHRQRRHGDDDAAPGRHQRVRDVLRAADRVRAAAVAATTATRYALSWMVVIVLEIGLGILGSMVTAWFSRQREFRADRGGATLAGRDHMLAALRRLAANRELIDPQHQALATMKISGTRGWMVFFSTHPPLEQRIAALERFQ